MTITQEQIDRIKTALNNCAFALETVAHLQGREDELLSIADDARNIVKDLIPTQERRKCHDCGRSLDFQGYCPKCDGDMYDD